MLRAEVFVANTWECNLRCSYCFVDHSKLSVGRRRMPKALGELVVDVLDQALHRVESICIHFYGGEPLLNPGVMKAMVARAQQFPPSRFSFAVTTNGTCLSPAVIDLLGSAQFEIVLSIDGPARVHDQCRRTTTGAPTHHRVVEFLAAVRSQTNCRVRGSSVVRSGWSLQEASRYLRTLPLDVHKAQAVRGEHGQPFALDESERRAYLNDLEGIGRQTIEDLEAGRAPRDDRYSSLVLQLLKGVRREAFCGAGETIFGITPEGDVLPCILLDRDPNLLGHIDDRNHGWVSAGLSWKAAKPRRAECEGCPALDLCGGGCPAMMPVCGEDECDLTRKNAEVSRAIYDHFSDRPTKLLALAGVT